ncbi:MAG: 50S ribosomal protein L18 [Candidatus Pacebacteria bacterium]|nr:50S ribosomal protein L18 [Candidatus Paceibacterota bacterium]
MNIKEKTKKNLRRKQRTRSEIKGNQTRPRLSVFRSNRHIEVQLIDDESARTLAFAGDKEVKNKNKSIKNIDVGFEVGKLIAKKATQLGIEKVIFDRGAYKYHGQVKRVAEGAREGGLKL